MKPLCGFKLVARYLASPSIDLIGNLSKISIMVQVHLLENNK